MTHEGFGKRIKAGLRLQEAPTLITRSFADIALPATECRADRPEHGLSIPMPREDAYLISVKFRDYPACECWERGRAVAKQDIRAGATYLYDLKRDPCYVIDKPFHSIFYHLSREALDATAREIFASPGSELGYEPAIGFDDPVMRHLSDAMVMALARPHEVNRLFLDHLSMAMTAHILRNYAIGKQPTPTPTGGLADWQMRRVCDLIEARLHGEILLRDLAAELDLSPGHFARAFKKSVGMAPHQWLLRRRVERACDLLRWTDRGLQTIALEVGFADQSHFTRTFTRLIGQSPHRWRRANGAREAIRGEP